MTSSAELISKIKTYNPKVDEDLICKAYDFAKTSHGDQKRHSGEAYFLHPIAVAVILTDLKLDQSSIITALLHDVVEDTKINLGQIEQIFGDEVAKLVDGVTKLGKIDSIPSSERVAENFRKLAIAMSKDIRVLLIKLADRLHNMRTIKHLPSKERQIKKAKESLDIYAPLAGRIGLNRIKDELQDLSFEIIDPDSRSYITTKLQEINKQNQNAIDLIIQHLEELLKAHDVPSEVYGRQKAPYSIWMKMKRRNVGFENLYDIMAFRIVVKDIKDCYRVLGIVNSKYSMIPNSFDDYISTPKSNNYQSLHLAIVGPLNKKIEIQIRDEMMHNIAEYGVASHWQYKEGGKNIQPGRTKDSGKDQYKWIRDLIALFESSEKASEALENQKIQLHNQMHNDEVFCFTPNGDIFNLPAESTVIDFAYEVHSEVGNRCSLAKVNGVTAPLRKKLENGDQVEIITSSTAKPSVNWLQFAHTSKAKHAIRSFIRNQKFDEYKMLGKSILIKFFASKKLDYSDQMLSKTLAHFHKRSVDDILVMIAEGNISRHEILKLLYPDFKEDEVEKDRYHKSLAQNNYSVPIEGLVDGMAVTYSKCCNPIYGDLIIGVIHTGKGVSIHHKKCRNLKNIPFSANRIIDVCWRYGSEDNFYPVQIIAIIQNKSGSLAEVSGLIAKKNINITNVNSVNRSTDIFELRIDLEVKNIKDLEEIFLVLRRSKTVIEVYRSVE